MSSSTNTLGRYQIVREIGRSNDIVYEAIDPSINRRVALKELWIPPNVQGAQKRERIERFRREGKAAGRLSHPNIVTIYEVGQEGDRFFIAMEFLEGQTLRDALQSGGPLSIKTATDYMLQLCSALSYAHANGVIHRDIKPENAQVLPGGHIKLTDFGIARLMEEPSITQDGQVFGTPSYMSPEQVSGKSLDPRSDIFSLGVVLYEMVAGQKPFTGDSVVTITYNIMHMEPPAPPGAPPYIAGIVRKAMAKEPDMRYSTVDAMADDLREQKCGDPAFGSDSQGTWPSPFGGAAQPQPPNGPLTPYGTPMPSPQAGSVPDPFSQSAPPPVPMAPPAPPKPIMSSETRNFVGVLLLAVGFVAMLAFAVWAVNLAYSSYVIAQTKMSAQRYYEQGNRLFNQGKIDEAVKEWQLAVERSPNSDIGGRARQAIYNAQVYNAYNQAKNNDSAALAVSASQLIELNPEAPEGHFYLGYAHELKGEWKSAVEEYHLAEQYGGNDQYALSARERMNRLKPGEALPDAGIQPQPPQSPDSAIPYEPSQ